MAPIVYTSGSQISDTTGQLPGYPLMTTWEELNDILKIAKGTIKNDYLAYLQADLDKNSDAKSAAVTAMNAKLAAVAQQYTALGQIRFYLLNNQSTIRAANPSTDVGNIEYGRTEIIVGQTHRYQIGNCQRTSGTTTRFTWYGCLAMGAFAKDCQYPAHVLKIALNPLQ